jgi:RHS repeat-associated protein
VEWSTDLDVWGNVQSCDNPHKLRQPIRMQGQHFDEESGLHYNRHRYYDPAQGRYITQDPIGLRGGWNGYSYVYQSPVDLSDPLGLEGDGYIINRDLSAIGDTASHRWNIATHTFTAVTDNNGNILHTYSWGNDANLKGWNLDQPIDLKTAREAIQKGFAEKLSPSSDCITEAFNFLNKKENEHYNLFLANNCKVETSKLERIATNICKSKNSPPLVKFDSSVLMGW